MPRDFKIETERLIMREFSSDDVDGMFELNSDEEVIRYTGDTAFADKQTVLNLINGYEQYSKYKMGRWTVLLKSSGEYIGFCGLKYLSDINETDLGFRLMKKYWNKGYATEASVATLDYGFDTLKLEKIVGRAATDNLRSLNVLQKLGMVFEKDFVAHRACQQFRITQGAWRKQRELISASKTN